jgi:hypothetical protein
MVFEFEPDACLGRHRINAGGTVLVTENGPTSSITSARRMRLVGEFQRRALKSSVFEIERDERRQLAGLLDGS